MNVSEEDLLNCEKEPIHIPGLIQSHGFLLALHPSTLRVEKLSESAFFYLNTDAAHLFSKHITEVIKGSNGIILQNLLSNGLPAGDFEKFDPAPMIIGHQLFEVIMHKNIDAVIIEFEEKNDVNIETTLKGFMTTAVANVTSARSLRKLSDNVVDIVKLTSGFDRVMIYQFHSDGHGEVISESRNDGLESLLHLHYPASDIPAQARQLYLKNTLRLISDVHSVPSRLLSLNKEDEKPLDLTHCVLRAVSPIHIEYLKNMGVAASFSVSLIYKNELWGLIACHNYETKPRLDYNARIACRFIGELFSASIERCTEDDMKDEILLFDQAEQVLNNQMLEDFDTIHALTTSANHLLSVNHATGAALCLDQIIYRIGTTPDDNEMKSIVRFIQKEIVADLYENDHLPLQTPLNQETIDVASGVLYISLFPGSEDYIIWFKPELIKTIDWAGNPEKSLTRSASGQERISPRISFDKWSAEKRNYSAGWSKAEVLTAVKLRNHIMAIQNRKLDEIKKRNNLLQTAYEELDTFSYTISHDLRTPLSAIINYTELILEEYDQEIPAPALLLLRKVVSNSGKMTSLINDVLEYSKLKRAGVRYRKINMQELLQQVNEQVKAAYVNIPCTIQMSRVMDIYGDETMIMQLFQNLIGNAVKYSGQHQQPLITIHAEPHQENFILYKITDNGIGFEMKEADKIFDLFHRLDNAKNIEGTGIGLAITKRLVEKNGGTIWAESRVGEGTSFFITFMKELRHLPSIKDERAYA